jgi:group I intron endonuclease
VRSNLGNQIGGVLFGDKMIGIYCIVNIVNGKKYIGESKDIQKRFVKHRKNLKYKDHKNFHLQSSWDKYGEDCFEFFILEECLLEDLDRLEVKYIEQYRTMDNRFGYNKESGGSKNKSISDETRRKQSIWKRMPVSLETKKKISEALKGRVPSQTERENSSMARKGKKRKPLSDEHKRKISISHIGLKRSDEVKKAISNALRLRIRKPFTEEAKAKMSKSRTGKKHSKEQIEKLSSSLKEMWRKRKELNETNNNK